MSADELESWLGEEDSAGAGWKKADESGETIGHERYVGIISLLPSTSQTHSSCAIANH